MSPKMTRISGAILVAGAFVLSAMFAVSAEAPRVDYAAVEELLKKITANQRVSNLTVLHQIEPSPVEGLFEVRFTFEAGGQRQTGILYIAGDKVILGTMIDLHTQQNLTALRAGPSEPLHVDLKDLELLGRVPRGKPGAKLVIVEFSDFQCPYCKRVHGTLKDLLRKYPNEVVLYYKHFPIVDSHPLAYKMAMATECARAQKAEAFWFFHDALFSDTPISGVTQLRQQVQQWGEQQGLESGKLLACFDKEEQAARIDRDMADAQKIGVAATPTFLLNGEFASGAMPIESFERYVKGK